MILIFNVFVFLNFAFIVPNANNNMNKNMNYNLMFKKLIKISNNPIIFEYQLEQINKINNIRNIQYKNDIQYICNFSNKKKTYKNYKKIKKILLEKNLTDIDETIIKLLHINFVLY